MAAWRERDPYPPEDERNYGAYDDAYGEDYGDDYPPYDDEYEDYGDYEGPVAYDDEGYPYGDDGRYYEDDAPRYGDDGYPPRTSLGDVARYIGDHNLGLGLLLLLLPPAGVALMWFRRRFRKRGRWIITAVAALWFALLVFLLVVRPILNRRSIPVTDGTVVEAPADQGQTQPVVVSDQQVSDTVSVFVSDNSPFYHQLENCQSFPAADSITHISRNSAIEKGLMSCPYCLGGQYSDALFDLKFVSTSMKDQSGTMVYTSAQNGSFHVDPKCSQLTDGRAVTLQDALLMGKTNCETCCPEASRQVFCTLDGKYYHYEGECSGMRDAQLVKLSEALCLGKYACPVCIRDTSGATLQTTEENSDAVYTVWATENGTYYHIEEHCSGMQNAKQVSLKQMLATRRPACPVCCPNASMTVYGERGNPYYHSRPNCSNMSNPSEGTLVEALSNGLSQCPNCWVAATDANAQAAS